MQNNPTGPVLPMSGERKHQAPQNNHNNGGGGVITLILLAAIAVLAVLIIKSATQSGSTVTVTDPNGWAINTATPTPQPELRPTAQANGLLPVYYNANTQSKLVAITVYNIPSASDVDRLLGLCGTYNAKLTFFVTGTQVSAAQSLWPQVVISGCEIEGMGLTGAGASGLSYDALEAEIDGFAFALRGIIGEDYQPHFHSTLNMDDYDNATLHKILAAKGYYGIASWSLTNPKSIDQIKPGQIIAIDLSSYGVSLLGEVMRVLEEQGYSVVTLNTLFEYPENLISGENA